jgi:hypothetical protein
MKNGPAGPFNPGLGGGGSIPDWPFIARQIFVPGRFLGFFKIEIGRFSRVVWHCDVVSQMILQRVPVPDH